MVRHLVLFVILFITWLIFSGMYSAFFIVLGVLSCGISVYFFSKMKFDSYGQKEDLKFKFSFKTLLYFLWLIKEIFKSAMDITKRVWQLEPDVRPVTAWVKTIQKHDGGLTLYANSITLTPGTVSITVEKGYIQVNAISPEGVESLETGEMDQWVDKASN